MSGTLSPKRFLTPFSISDSSGSDGKGIPPPTTKAFRHWMVLKNRCAVGTRPQVVEHDRLIGQGTWTKVLFGTLTRHAAPRALERGQQREESLEIATLVELPPNRRIGHARREHALESVVELPTVSGGHGSQVKAHGTVGTIGHVTQPHRQFRGDRFGHVGQYPGKGAAPEEANTSVFEGNRITHASPRMHEPLASPSAQSPRAGFVRDRYLFLRRIRVA